MEIKRGKRLRVVGEILTRAAQEGRDVTIGQGTGNTVVVTTTPADDLGHRFVVGPKGGVKDEPLS
jgi:hypothetical protein